MRKEILEFLKCPATKSNLILIDAEEVDGQIKSGRLESEEGNHFYVIKDFIPRFVPKSNYADNFGMQWNLFSKTQLDSNSGHPISFNRFWKATGWNENEIKGKWVLDAGCGSGRFAEIALKAGANLIALDYSSAVDACYENLKEFPNLHVVQGDIYNLPFIDESFDFIYSLGVLQHTPDVANAFGSLPSKLKKGGSLCTDFYWKRFRTMLHSKYIFRPITKKLSQKKLFNFLKIYIPLMLPISSTFGKIPVIGKYLKRFFPIADYTGDYPLNKKQMKEWALLDTFDMLAPAYDNPQTANCVKSWFEKFNFLNVEIFHEGHLVGRGRKPT